MFLRNALEQTIERSPLAWFGLQLDDHLDCHVILSFVKVSWVDSPCGRLSRRTGWDDTELLHQSELVNDSPVLAG
jgi:hypothetical protein